MPSSGTTLDAQAASPPHTATASWLPVVSVTSSLSLLLIAYAYSGSRFEIAWAYPLFWGGLALLTFPILVRLVGVAASPSERVGLVCMLAMGLFTVKVLHSPVAFTFSDELIHWRNTTGILVTDYLFGLNPVLPASVFYPGLEIATAALVSVTGVSVFAAGTVVLGASRLLSALCLFAFFRQVGRSDRLAGIAVALYAANPNFVYFGAQFAYESLALPLMTMVLTCLVLRRDQVENRVGLTLILLLGLGAVVVTHHLTAFALAGFLVLWMIVDWLYRSLWADREALTPDGAAAFAIVATLSWLVYVAVLTVSYFALPVSGAIREMASLIQGDLMARELFRDFAGQQPPLWERLLGLASVFLILLILPFGLYHLWRSQTRDTLVITLGVAVLAYPASLGARLVQRAAEISNRSSEFLFLAVSFVLAVGVSQQLVRAQHHWLRAALCTVWVGAILLGGLIVGWPHWGRMPGPYLVAADTRSVEPTSISAAYWFLDHLGPGNRVLTDRSNRLFLNLYGNQYVTTTQSERAHLNFGWEDIGGLILKPQLYESDRDLLRRIDAQYLVIDRRLSEGLPLVGVYVEQGEPDTFKHIEPPRLATLMKYDDEPNVSRIYDDGVLVIYDVRALD